MNKEVYVDVLHLNFWWGIYGFIGATDWEDLVFYEKQGDEFVRIGSVSVCSKTHLKSSSEKIKSNPVERAFAAKVQRFLAGDALVYSYTYDEPDDKEFYEVPFEAERNEKGVKPCYIEMWYPSDGVTMAVVEACTITFCRKFLNQQVDTVSIKDTPPLEKIVHEYKEYEAMMRNGPVTFTFAEELVESLAKDWQISKEEVLKTLTREADRSR
jgi:hypothetical protein